MMEMNNNKWNGSDDVEKMREMLDNKEVGVSEVSTRKLRLFACACVREIWSKLPELCQKAIKVAELYCDGKASRNQLDIYRKSVNYELQELNLHQPNYAIAACSWAIGRHPRTNRRGAGVWGAASLAHKANPTYEAKQKQSDLLRDIVGSWGEDLSYFDAIFCTPTVLSIASSIYQAREFSALPVLADALEDVGCIHRELMEHLRSNSSSHCLGCWALDLVLGKW
jgi:hypothetical protein